MSSLQSSSMARCAYSSMRPEEKVAYLMRINKQLQTIEKKIGTIGRALVFDTYEDMIEWLMVEEHLKELVVGQSIFIRDPDSPDYWYDGVEIKEIIGEKVDLTDYEKKSEHTADLVKYETKEEHTADLAKYVDKSTFNAKLTLYPDRYELEQVLSLYVTKIVLNNTLANYTTLKRHETDFKDCITTEVFVSEMNKYEKSGDHQADINAINIKFENYVKKSDLYSLIADSFFPVGSIMIRYDTKNPSSLTGLSGTTWTLLNAGYSLQTASTNIGVAGGSMNTNGTSLTLNQIPSHNHTFTTNTAGSHQHEVVNKIIYGEYTMIHDGSTNTYAEGGTNCGGSYNHSIYTASHGGHTHTGTTDSTGGSSSHSHTFIPLHIKVAVWRRTA